MKSFSDSEQIFFGNPFRRELNSQSYPRSPTETSSDTEPAGTQEESLFGKPFRRAHEDGLSGVPLNHSHQDSGNPFKQQILPQDDSPLIKLSSGNLFPGASRKRPREDSDNPPSKRQHLLSSGKLEHPHEN
ncbi:uncharacterized protein BDV17DRAFT_74712 [Aspergillus undulatus]|uniref:uncharacterized protein n=1 Tax=Aspergillus undulatus TaxID=1810928 RepID=UPI003CCD10AB